MSTIAQTVLNMRQQLRLADWSSWPKATLMDAWVADAPNELPMPSYAWFSMLLPTTPENQKRAMARIAERFSHTTVLPPPTYRGTRPRIGYIGSKLDADHVSGLLFSHLFPHHDPDKVDVFVFLTRTHADNHNRQRLFDTKQIAVVSLDHLQDAEAAEVVRDYGIDLLISTDGWNDDPRPGIVAARPAHKQAWWQGTATTSGAPWIDYIVVDDIIDSQERGWRTEQAIRLPSSYYLAGHVHNPRISSIPSRESLGIPTGSFVFSNLNGPNKLNPDVWYDWMQILKACPNSVLLQLEMSVKVSSLLKERARQHGVNPERLLFVPVTDPWTHIARAGVADLMLDTYYYNAHTTLAETLWMGVPAVTLVGDTMSARVGYSMLNSVGLSDLAVNTRQSYIDLARMLYREPQVLREFRERLAITKHQSAIFEMRKQARAIEEFVLSLP